MESRAEIEAALRDLIDSKGVAQATSTISRPMALGQLIRLARSEKIIDPQTSALLDDLRVIANKAAHDTVAIFTSDEALRFRDLVTNKQPNSSHEMARTAAAGIHDLCDGRIRRASIEYLLEGMCP